MDYRRTHNAGELSRKDQGKEVTLSGWVHRRRDHGGLIFIDLRDRFGITQLVFDPNKTPETYEKAKALRSEWVITAQGNVSARAPGMTNAKLATGEIEIAVNHMQVLSSAKTPPFSISDEESLVNEEIRLKYRYLDIRRGQIAKNLVMRCNAMQTVRAYLCQEGFLEIQTPLLAKSTPEGARDYLVPSRLFSGNFYALPQSPQIFKQLLMVSGMDRYFQIAACFRDEDLRSDRQPEFTQIDLEMSFAHPDDLMKLMEGMLAAVFKECAGKEINTPFPHLSYTECIEHYGTDRPDLRFEMRLTRIDQLAKASSFTVFHDALSSGGSVKALCVPGGEEISRREIDNYTQFIAKFGVGGLAWIKRQKEGFSSNIAKFFTESQLVEVAKTMKANVGDLIIIAAGAEMRINQGLDHLRRHIAHEKGLIPKDTLRFLWVCDFPAFRKSPETGKIESEHHPFTSPHPDDISLIDSDPLKVRALAYDLVLNGYELGGGSQRIHSPELQEKIFRRLALSEEEIQEKFGFFVEALQYGTPPHLGIALGLDRLIMLLVSTDNIRDVIAFPKTQRASDLMMQCPSPVSKEQLNELQIRTDVTPIHWIS